MDAQKTETASDAPSLTSDSTPAKTEYAKRSAPRASLRGGEATDNEGSGTQRRRRMSTGMVDKFPHISEFPESMEAAIEDEGSKWEDWQEFATSGESGDPEAVASGRESQSLLAALEPYVPHLLFHSLLYDPETQLGKTPAIHTFFGAVMIADISGFTTLTERALTSKRGTELIEELLVAMNNYFSEACDIVLMFGGDIVKYAGDAMIICFPQCAAVNETEDALALRAASCAFELITCLGVYTPELGGYGDTLIPSESQDDIKKKQRKFSRITAPENEEDDDIRSDLRVLVVDDSVINRVVLRQMLVKLNCQVMEAASGKEAVAANSSGQFDAIFMAVHMPGMDGCLATRQIRESSKPKTPVIGVRILQKLYPSAFSFPPEYFSRRLETSVILDMMQISIKYDDDLRKRCINAGMNQLFVKPLVMPQLVSLLRGLKVVSNHDVIDESLVTEKNPVPGGGIKTVYTEHSKPKDAVKDPKRRPSEQRRGSEQTRQNITNVAQPKTETQSVSPLDAPVVLTMKVLVGMGQVAMLSVGGGSQLPYGKPRWEYFMVDVPLPSDTNSDNTRKPMEQLRLCEELATPGSVILSPDVWAHCQTYCEAKNMADGFVQLLHVRSHSFTQPAPEVPYDVRRVPVAVSILKRYLPEMLTSKLEAASAKDSGAADVRPEVRHVTCLFLGFPGLSNMRCTDSDLLNYVQKIMLAVQKSLRLFDGLLVQFKVDEKGYVMICAFGFPGNLHEDDPKRGIQTALDIQNKLATAGESTDIGVTTGKLLCTGIGSKKRREYTAFGNCINLSARLMKKANNEVLIDMDTYKLTKNEFQVEALPPMKVKGRTGLIDVYRVVSSKTSVVGVKDVRRLSKASTSASKNFEVDLKTKLRGRKVEMDLALSTINAFIARYSGISPNMLSDGNTVPLETGPLQATESADTHGSFLRDKTTGFSSEINDSGKNISLTAEEVGCTIIVISGQAGIGKTMVMQVIGGHFRDSPLEVIAVGAAHNNLLVYGVWVKLLLDLLPFEPSNSPEEKGLILLKYLHPDLHEKAYLLKDVLKVQFKESSPANAGRRKSDNLRRTSSERVNLRKGSMRRRSFISRLAAKGALLIAATSSPTDYIESESRSPTPTSLDSGFASEVEAPLNSDAEDLDLQIETINTSESSNSTKTQIVTTEVNAEDIDPQENKRSSVDSTLSASVHDSEKLSLLNSTITESNVQGTKSNDGGFARSRRRSSTELHLRKTSSPEVKIQWLGQLLLDLLLAAAKTPLLIFLEDAHLMDNPSWSLLRGLSEEKNSGILVVAACRPLGAHAPKDYTKIIEAESTLLLHLKELNEESTEALVRQKIISGLNPDINIPPQVFRAISRRTRGHPMFAEQMAMALVESTLKSADSSKGKPNALRTLDLDTFNFSHSIEALIASRVDLLEPNQGLVLKVASVIGLTFSVDALHPILSEQLQREDTPCLAEPQLHTILQGLEKLNFITHHIMDPEGVYSFANSVSRDIIYEMLPMKQRRAIHADIAKELLSQGGSGVVRCVSIAEHYTMACRDVEEMEIDLTTIAIDHWQEAATSAMFKLGQYKLATQYYENAICLGRIVHDHIHSQRIAGWHFYLGKAYNALGDLDKAFRNFIIALDYIGENFSESAAKQQVPVGCSSSLAAELSSWKTQCRIGLLNWFDLVTGRLGNKQDILFRCEALSHLTSILLSRDDVSSARKVAKRYVTVASGASRLQPLELARAYVLSAVVAKSASRAKCKYQKTLEILRLTPRIICPAIQGDIHFNLAQVYQFQGKWPKAVKHTHEAEMMYKASRGRRELDICRCLLGLTHFFQGQFEISLGLGTRVLEHEHEHPQLLLWSVYLVVACLNALERYMESAEVLARLDENACSLEHLTLQMKALGWVSAMHVGDHRATAQEAVADVPRLLEFEPQSPAYPIAYASAAEVLLTSLEKHDMPDDERLIKEKLVERLVQFFKTATRRMGICYTYFKFYDARLTLARGNSRSAIHLFEEAMKQALKFRMMTVLKQSFHESCREQVNLSKQTKTTGDPLCLCVTIHHSTSPLTHIFTSGHLSQVAQAWFCPPSQSPRSAVALSLESLRPLYMWHCATTARNWFETCKRRFNACPDFVYSKLATSLDSDV